MRSIGSLFIAIATFRKWPAGIYLNLAILENAVEHYFRDVSETKAKHGIDNADRHKRASFTLKWLSRLRPVQIERGVLVSKTEHLLINEIFAVFAALEHLDVSFHDVDAKWLFNMIYTLRYRDLNAEAMASEMYLLEQTITVRSSP